MCRTLADEKIELQNYTSIFENKKLPTNIRFFPVTIKVGWKYHRKMNGAKNGVILKRNFVTLYLKQNIHWVVFDLYRMFIFEPE